MTKNPFIWFSIKIIKSKPIIHFITLITTIGLSVYIKDVFILMAGLLFLVLQTNIEPIRSNFFNSENDVIFFTPFSPRLFIKKLSNAICLQSLILIEIELIINMVIQNYHFIQIIVFST